MRTLMLALVLAIGSSCFALTEEQQNIAAADMDNACRGMANINMRIEQCKSMDETIKGGGHVNAMWRYNMCGPSGQKVKAYVEENQREYKKVTHKKIDYSQCAPETNEGLRQGWDL